MSHDLGAGGLLVHLQRGSSQPCARLDSPRAVPPSALAFLLFLILHICVTLI